MKSALSKIVTLLFFALFSQLANGQYSNTTASYTTAEISTKFNSNTTLSDDAFGCGDTLTVSIGTNRIVYAVDVFYSIRAFPGAQISQQSSFVEFLNTKSKEAAVSVGNPNSIGAGVATYSRYNLTFANGPAGNGELKFFLHAFRSGNNTPNCGTTNQVVLQNSFSVKVYHYIPPSCPKPTSLLIDSINANSAKLSWNTGGATNWQIAYGTGGYNPTNGNGSGSVINANTNPVTLFGLTPLTYYQFYVRDSCAPGDVSQWSPVANGRTTCGVITAPHTENFDGSEWIYYNQNSSIIPECWLRPSNSAPNFAPKSGSTLTTNTGPSGDATTGAGKYIYTEATASNPNIGEITTPLINIPSTLSNPRLGFKYHMYGSDIDSLEVLVEKDGVRNRLGSIVGQQQTSNNSNWLLKYFDLSAYSGDTIRVVFVGNSTGYNGDIAIDDFSIEATPPCVAPTALAINNVSGTSVSLGWISGGASNWQIEYGTPGFTLGTGTLLNASSNPFRVTGLSPLTSYEFYIRDSCGATSLSMWSFTSVSTVTDCLLTTAPFSENFDGAAWSSGISTNTISNCWKQGANSQPDFITGSGSTPTTFSGPSADFSGSGNYLYTEATIASGVGEITSPAIYVPPSITHPRVGFKYHMYGSNIISLRVFIERGGNRNQIGVITGEQQDSSAAAWLQKYFTPGNIVGDTVRIVFVATTNGYNGDIAIDEVVLENTCFDPDSISFSNTTSSSIIVNWNSNSGSSDIEIVPQGAPQGTGVVYTAVTSPFLITGLAALTSYDVYVRDNCGSVKSPWINNTFTTLSCDSVLISNVAFSRTSLSTNFSAMVTGEDSLHWDFGNGNTSVLQNPTEVYSAAGTYRVILSAYNGCGNDAADTLMIDVCDSIIPNFTFATTNDSVFFDATATSGASLYYWDFGNGNTKTGAQPTLLLLDSIMTITLILDNACGDSVVFSQTIKLCKPPLASWTHTIISTSSSGMLVQFDATASKNVNNYNWDFGDGNTTTGTATPLHNYVTPGLNYQVSLIASNACGNFTTSAYKLNQIGLEENLLDAHYTVYPNPASDDVTIDFESATDKPTKVELYDLQGKLLSVYAVDALAESITIDIHNVASGTYLLKVTDGEGVHITRVTKY